MRLMNQSYQVGKRVVTPHYGDGHLWVTSKQMGEIVGITQRVVNHHLSDLRKSGRIGDNATERTKEIERMEGSRDVTRAIKHYSERVVFLVALRSNSDKAADFQDWVLDVLSELRQKGVVYATPQPKLVDNTQVVSTSDKELTELKAKVAQLQATINECNMDMNEGQVPWLGGFLPKRVAYLIGSQRGVRPRAKDLPLVLPAPTEDSESLAEILYVSIPDEGITLLGIRDALRAMGIDLDRRTLETELRLLELAGRVKRLVPRGSSGRLIYHYFIARPLLGDTEERGRQT